MAFGTKLGSSHDKSGFFQMTSQKEKGSPSSSCPIGEAKAAFEAVKEIVVFRGILKEITGIELPPTELLEDNSSVIRASSDYMQSTLSRKMKHERLLFHSLMWYVKNGIIDYNHTLSHDMPMDAGTKPLDPTLHWHHVPKLMGESEEIDHAKSKALHRKAIINFSRTYTNDLQQIKLTNDEFTLHNNSIRNSTHNINFNKQNKTNNNLKVTFHTHKIVHRYNDHNMLETTTEEIT
jgi:hypothetical protein